MKTTRASIACVLAMCSTYWTAWAVDPVQRISQYAHTAWRVQDGYFEGNPTSIAQTSDGYIWVGTESGLLRFDGVRFVPLSIPSDRLSATANVYSLLATRDGSLWIGAGRGLAHWKDRSLVNYLDASGRIESMREDQHGRVWAVLAHIGDASGPLCQVESSALRCYGKSDGIEASTARSLAVDSNDNIWIGSTNMLVRRGSSGSTTYKLEGLKSSEGLSGINGLVASRDGSLWVGIDHSGPGLGLQHFQDGTWKAFSSHSLDGSSLTVSALLLDREGALWVGTASQGVYRIHDQRVDHYQSTDGLSGDTVTELLEDAEGNIWVITPKGVDSFRDLAVISYTKSEGLTSDSVNSVLSSPDGTVWIANEGALDLLNGTKIHSIPEGKGLPGHRVTGLLQDHSGRLWVGVDNKLFVYVGGHFTEITRPVRKPTGIVTNLVEDVDGVVWASTFGIATGLVEIRNDEVVGEFSSPRFRYTTSLAADPKGGIWMSFITGDVVRFINSHMEDIPIPKSAKLGRIERLIVDTSGVLWMGAATGIGRWDGEKLSVLNDRNEFPCQQVSSLIFDSNHSLWLSGKCGIVRIDEIELRHWTENPETRVKFMRFDTFDGAHPASASFSPPVTRSPDGRLWIATASVLQMIDPASLHFNGTLPPVHIEDVIADGRSDWSTQNLKLPALTHDIQIDYTALSFVMPRRVRFRYKLDGHDKMWQDASIRRSVFYTNLGPGTYTFHVIACNNDGVWNTYGASLTFTIDAAWYQTLWFKIIDIVLGLGLLCALYVLREKQYERSFRVRFDERLEERTRLARDLHDTLLQTIQASKIVADEALEHYSDPTKTHKLLQRLSSWLGQAMQEGRYALHSLRASTLEQNDLANSLRAAAEECRNSRAIQLNHRLIGRTRDMHPIVRDELYLIGYEAIRNSCFHSGGTCLGVDLEYSESFVLRIRDNGLGTDPKLLRAGKPGHFGLAGMRERAVRIGAQLSIRTSPGNGTEVTLIVPGNVVYKTPADMLFVRVRSYLKRLFHT